MNSKYKIDNNRFSYLGHQLKLSDLTGVFLRQPLNPKTCLDCTLENFISCSQDETLPDTPQCRARLFEDHALTQLQN